MHNNQYTNFWTPEEDLIIRAEFIKRTPHKEVQKLLPHRGLMAVKHRARNLGLNRDYSVNHNFFQVPNLINSYVAGFTAADGYISIIKKKNSHSVRWNLSNKDTDQLYKIKALLNYNGPVLRTKTRNEVFLYIHSEKIVADLEANFNIVTRKSLILEPPKNLNYENSLAYIVGYIDGDGSIMIRKSGRPALGIVGTESVLCWIRGFFNGIAPPIKISIGAVTKFKESNAFHYILSGRRVRTIFSTLYSVKVPKLERKWRDKADKILEWRPKT